MSERNCPQIALLELLNLKVFNWIESGWPIISRFNFSLILQNFKITPQTHSCLLMPENGRICFYCNYKPIQKKVEKRGSKRSSLLAFKQHDIV